MQWQNDRSLKAAWLSHSDKGLPLAHSLPTITDFAKSIFMAAHHLILLMQHVCVHQKLLNSINIPITDTDTASIGANTDSL